MSLSSVHIIVLKNIHEQVLSCLWALLWFFMHVVRIISFFSICLRRFFLQHTTVVFVILLFGTVYGYMRLAHCVYSIVALFDILDLCPKYC